MCNGIIELTNQLRFASDNRNEIVISVRNDYNIRCTTNDLDASRDAFTTIVRTRDPFLDQNNCEKYVTRPTDIC